MGNKNIHNSRSRYSQSYIGVKFDIRSPYTSLGSVGKNIDENGKGFYLRKPLVLYRLAFPQSWPKPCPVRVGRSETLACIRSKRSVSITAHGHRSFQSLKEDRPQYPMSANEYSFEKVSIAMPSGITGLYMSIKNIRNVKPPHPPPQTYPESTTLTLRLRNVRLI